MEQRRDLELGAALSALPYPQLPDDMDARLRAAIEVERRRRRRRRSVAALGLAASWRRIVLGGALAAARRRFPADFATFSQLWYSGPAVAEEKPLQIGTMPS